MAGDLNVKLEYPEEDHREEEIMLVLEAVGLDDMSAHFLPRLCPWCQYGRMWSMVQLGREVRYRTDYILGTDLSLLRNVVAQYPRHNSDHYLVLVCLRIAPLREHTKYLGRRTLPPLRPLTTPTREYGLSTVLLRTIPKPKSQEARKDA